MHRQTTLPGTGVWSAWQRPWTHEGRCYPPPIPGQNPRGAGLSTLRHQDCPMNMRVDHSRMANAIRALAMDAVEQAKSGHPGLPMGMADVATVLFTHFLKFDAADPDWPDRDRFVLSAGHGSMLLYSLLYLTGYPRHDARRASSTSASSAVADAGPSRIWPSRRASRPPPARSARASPTPSAWRWPSGMLERALRRRSRRSQDLCARLRRRPDGRHQPGGDRARRASEAQQADRAVRRQRHLHRRPAVAVGLRRPGRSASRPPAGRAERVRRP